MVFDCFRTNKFRLNFRKSCSVKLESYKNRQTINTPSTTVHQLWIYQNCFGGDLCIKRHKKCNFNKSPQSFCWVVTIERFNAVGKLVFTWVRASLVKLLPDASSELNEVYGTPPPNPTSSWAPCFPCFPFRALSLGSEGFQEWSSQPSKSIKRVETCKTVHLAWCLTLTTDAHTQTHAPRPLLPQRKRLHQNSPHLLAQSAPRPGWDWTRFITPLWCISSFNFTALHTFFLVRINSEHR